MPLELVECATPECHSRTLPAVAARTWKDGICGLCLAPESEKRALRDTIRRAQVRFGIPVEWEPEPDEDYEELRRCGP
jgi:hypothetical protein